MNNELLFSLHLGHRISLFNFHRDYSLQAFNLLMMFSHKKLK